FGRWALFLCLSVLLVFGLAACGDDDDDDAGGETPTTTDGETPSDGETPADGETPGDGAPVQAGPIDVMGVWGGEEEQNFRAMVEPWETETGGSLDYTGTRDLTQQLTIRVQ